MTCEYFLFPFIVADGVGMSTLQKDDCGILTSSSTVQIPGTTQQLLPLCATTTTERQAQQKSCSVAMHQSQAASFGFLMLPMSTWLYVRWRWWRFHIQRSSYEPFSLSPPPPLGRHFRRRRMLQGWTSDDVAVCFSIIGCSHCLPSSDSAWMYQDTLKPTKWIWKPALN